MGGMSSLKTHHAEDAECRRGNVGRCLELL